jgi:hypothetical protein
MGNVQPQPAKIGHLVIFPNSENIDPPSTQFGAWATRVVENAEDYKFAVVMQHPSSWTEVDEFLYVIRDSYARMIVSTTLLCHLLECPITTIFSLQDFR